MTLSKILNPHNVRSLLAGLCCKETPNVFATSCKCNCYSVTLIFVDSSSVLWKMGSDGTVFGATVCLAGALSWFCITLKFPVLCILLWHVLPNGSFWYWVVCTGQGKWGPRTQAVRGAEERLSDVCSIVHDGFDGRLQAPLMVEVAPLTSITPSLDCPAFSQAQQLL